MRHICQETISTEKSGNTHPSGAVQPQMAMEENRVRHGHEDPSATKPRQCGECPTNRLCMPSVPGWRSGACSSRASLGPEIDDLPRLETYAGAVLRIINAVPGELLVGPQTSAHELTAREMLALLVYSYGQQTYSSDQIEKQLLGCADPENPQYRKIPTVRRIRRFRRNNMAVLIGCLAKLLASASTIRRSTEKPLFEEDLLAAAEDRVRTAILLDVADDF